MPSIHPTAIVDPKAQLAADVEVGPYALVGPDVKLAEGVCIESHAVVKGHTSIGPRSKVYSFACIGGPPQDKGFAGEDTQLIVGQDTVLREHVTVHTGTPGGGGCTRIGDDNLIMNSAHVAHDCQVGSHCIIASYVGLAGHVTVEDYAVLGAYVGVHQFNRIGESVMAAANAKIVQDAPPFSLVAGDRARIAGINSVGLRRRNFSPEVRKALKHAYHILFQSKLMQEPAFAKVREEVGDCPQVAQLLKFLETCERGYCR
ncbi:MAG: acyl-ACP--UDP-N-acetylglucosamine O-acyltransferase [Deltaproteobacteria bacterium]|nr:acyl-ACP--UDP-N-acetylglucosamine O-acyltransferase [Deltaproteobacteria bacterium]